ISAAVGPAIVAALAGVAQGTGVALVRLDLLRERRVHRREVRVGDNDLVAEALEVLRHPLTFGRRFDQDVDGRSLCEESGEFLASSLESALDELTVLSPDTKLT